jgi:hypothetical protein
MAPFQRDDILIVKPADPDDPEALAREGQRCRFLRYAEAPGKLATYCIVEFAAQGRRFYLRQQDLEKAEAADA